jgi:hypothetical protein
VKQLLTAGAIGVVLAVAVTFAVVDGRRSGQPAVIVPPTITVTREPPVVPPQPQQPQPPAIAALDGGSRIPGRQSARAKRRAAIKAAIAWVNNHPDVDPRPLLDFADSAHADRDGTNCLMALNQVPVDAWPSALAERALRRRATCEMLRGNCEKGRRLLEPLDGPDGSRGALLANCPVASLPTVEDRILAVSAQADEARYSDNSLARRRELRQALARQTASAEIQACFRNSAESRACGRQLNALARAYQVLAESYLVAGDCIEGASLDVLRSQVKYQAAGPDGGDPALRCRAERVFAAYKSCGEAGENAERRCLKRLQPKN